MEEKVITSNRRSRFTVGVAVALLVTVAAVAGCSGKNASKDAKGGTLSIYTVNPTWSDGITAMGKSLKATTGFDLKNNVVPASANFAEVVQNSLQTNKPGDLVKWWNGKQLARLAATGGLTDVTKVWDAAVSKGWLDDGLRSSYSYDGKVYGLPMSQSYWVVFYNKHVFEKYGLKPPTTYAEFESNAATLKSHGVTPMWSSQKDGWTPFIPYQMLAGAVSPDFYSKLIDDKASFDDPASKQVFDVWGDWIKNGWMTAPDSSLVDVPALMKADKLAMAPIGTWESASLKAGGLKPGVDYGAFLMPALQAGTPQAVFTETSALVVPKNSPHKDAALKTLGDWLNPTAQKQWADFLGDASPNPTVTSADPVITDIIKQVNDSHATLLNRYYEAFPPALVEESISALGGFMTDTGSLDKVLKTLLSVSDKEWAAWNKQG